MKYLFIVLSFTLFLFISCDKKIEQEATFVDEFGITWQKNLSDAFKKAHKDNKIIMVMAVSKGCGWCKKMKKETLSHPKVQEKLKEYIWVQADRETPSQKNKLPNFKHVPIIFFMSSDRELIDNLRGFFSWEDFLYYIDEMQEDLKD